MKPIFESGDEFHGYVVEGPLGKGGLGAVWLARHKMLDTRVAIKTLDPGIAAERPEFVKRFVREAKLASMIRHPNLVSVHDAGYDDAKGVYYLVMDYVRGDTLRDALALGGPMPEADAVRVVLQVADALDAAQRYGVVHRDLKPENVMIAPDGSARLLDLGVAKAPGLMDSLMTVARTALGTPAYISPEQVVDASSVDARADVYSLGVILFEMLSGRRPYSGETPVELLRQVLSPEPVPDLRTACPSVSPALAEVVAKMCAKSPEDRYATPGELAAALRALGYSAPSAPVQPGPDAASVGTSGSTSMATLIAGIDADAADAPVAADAPARRPWLRIAVRALAAAAVAALVVAALRAYGAPVRVADCERDPDKDVWASADVRFCRAVMDDVFKAAAVDVEPVPFGPDAMADVGSADVVCAAFRTPRLLEKFDFPLQPLGRMHFALYATPEKAKAILAVKITDWPRMRVGYSPVSMGQNDDRERYFQHATLNPEYVEFPTSAGAVEALKSGDIDVLFLYSPIGKRPEGLVEVVPIGSRNIYFGVRKDRPDLLLKLAEAYRECYIERIDAYDALRERLLGVPKPKKRVRVAAYRRGHLFDVSPDGDRTGIVEDWLNAVGTYAHWDIDYVYGDYDNSLKDVTSGRLDIVGGIGFSAERSEKFLYPHTPIGMLRVYLWTKRDSRFQPGEPDTWKGMKVGLLAGALSAQRVRRQLRERPLDIECVEYGTDYALTKAYFDGEVDACVNIEMPVLDNERALHIYASHPMYLCTSPRRRDLFFALEKALDDVCDDFPKYMKMITERHYGMRSEMAVLTISEAEWLRERRKDPSPVLIDFSPWPIPLKNSSGRNTFFAGAFLEELSKRTGLNFDTQEQTGIQTAEAKFLRGDTMFWIPYPERIDPSGSGGVSVFSIHVPQSYAELMKAERNDELEMWASANAPPELVSIIRKAVSSFEPMQVQELLLKAVAERTTEHRVFGRTAGEIASIAFVVGFATITAIAVFAVVMMVLLRRQVKRANQAAATAEEYSRAKTRFLAMMSHELRTPLNAVIGFAEFLARDECGEERRREYIEGIQLSANALLDLINDILDLTKLDTGAMHMRLGECDVGKAVEELPAIFAHQVDRTGVALSVRRRGDAEIPVVRLSQQGLRQILINLVGNSVKFTERGSIDVEFEWRPETRTLVVEVRDTGCGISSAKMDHLFDPFVQDIASRMKQADGAVRGTGLGLPIVKRMVDNAGGTVKVSSEPGAGTSFTIEIPGLAVVRPAPPRHVAEECPPPRSVLVVDDMAINRKILGIHLRNLGVADVRFAENGVAALAAMKDWKPDAVLTDMWMPEMDGQQLAEAMKRDESLADVPVMAITADVDVASSYDMSSFRKIVSKPVTGEKLRALFRH